MTWEAVLDQFEHNVALAEQNLDAGLELDHSLVAPFSPPAGLGPLPESLRDRAISILSRQTELEQRLDTTLGTLARELGDVTRASNTGRRLSPFAETVVPQYFDIKG